MSHQTSHRESTQEQQPQQQGPLYFDSDMIDAPGQAFGAVQASQGGGNAQDDAMVAMLVDMGFDADQASKVGMTA